MKMSLQDLFDVDHATLFHEFASKPVHSAYKWAISRLEDLNKEAINGDEPYSATNTALRLYRAKSLSLYQGNFDEICSMVNTGVRKAKIEPKLLDILNTVA